MLRSLAHGAVWLSYHPDLPAEQLQRLRDLVDQAEAERGEPLIILAPSPNLYTNILATAWRVQLYLDDASDPRLRQFLKQYQGGPYTPEPGVACTDGVGQPTG